MTVQVLVVLLLVVVGVLAVYTVRHYLFTFNRLFGRQRQPYVDIAVANWPSVTVFVPCHNEEQVVAGSLEALLAADYPHDRLTITPIDDRSTDTTGDILRSYAARHPSLVRPVFRTQGQPGKAAALAEVSPRDKNEIHLFFDADYVPGPKLLKQLVAPFFDPEVGAVMGRVVPHNVNRGLLTRLLDLERAGGYQVDQQARMNLGLIPQYGGTVGGVRREALVSVGGWRTDTLAEDTDVTFRLLLQGWDVVYQNRSECYEEVPEAWETRIRQIRRWAHGHNQSLRRYLWPVIRRSSPLGLLQAVDGVLLLGVFAVAPLLLAGWILAMTIYYLGYPPSWTVLALLAVSGFSTLGNFAAFFEIAAATRLDGSRRRIRLLPFMFFGFLVSLMAVSQETLKQLVTFRRRRRVVWHKTERYRESNGLTNGLANGERAVNGYAVARDAKAIAGGGSDPDTSGSHEERGGLS
ncbi:MAG: Beta-monoglucosyldiacylglycerol synthase [Gemmatimonadaceae bacterium]|nr:Beta-monoglucosyldiacylglycerol synthase [Gemmatimonadaceae bacterium]